VVLLAGLVAVMRPRWRLAVERRARVVYYFMPDTRLEQAWWIGVSILAGVSEEITWRGVQTGLLAAATQNYPLAAVITAVSFGLAHIVQGARSAAMIGLISLAFQTIVALSGSLYVAMAVHVAYDIVAGLSYGRLGRTLGYEPPAPVGPTPRVPQP
jgi:membrane protease YdiL (CAAX protease family)